MATFDDAQRDAADLAKLVNEDTDVTTRYGTNPKVSAPKAIRLIETSGTDTVNQIQTDAANAIATLNTSRGFRDVGNFASGFTYELPNDVAIDGSGNYWAYADINALPVTISAGTTPTEGEYSQRTWNEASAVVTAAGINAQQFIDNFELKIFQSPTDNLTKVSTFAGGVGVVYEVRKASDNSLATIYSDKDGITEIPQSGTVNVSNGDAECVFYIEDGEYTVNASLNSKSFRVNYGSLSSYTTSELQDLSLSLGQKIVLTDRANSIWTAVPSGAPANGFNKIDIGAGISVSLDGNGDDVYNSKSYGVVGDGVTDNIEAIRAMQVLSRFIQLPSGDVYVSEPVVLTVGQTINGLGISHTAIITDGDYDAVQLGANADFTQISNLSLRYTGGGQSLTSAAYRPEPADGGNNHVLLNVSISNFKIAMGLGTKWWSSLAVNVRCNNCGTDIKCFGLGQAINNTFINFYSNKPTERAIDIRAAKNWTFVTPNFGGDAAGVFGSYMQIGTNSKGIKFINPNFEGEGTIAYPEGQSGIEILSNSTVTFDNPTFTTNVGQGPGLSYEIEARDSSTVVVNYPDYISQGANMGRFKTIGSAKIVLTGGSQSDIDDSGSSIDSISVDERVRTGYRAEGVAAGVVAGDIIDTGLGETIKHVEANIIWSGDTRATVIVNVSDRFGNGTFKVRFTDIITGGVAAGTFDVYWFAK